MFPAAVDFADRKQATTGESEGTLEPQGAFHVTAATTAEDANMQNVQIFDDEGTGALSDGDIRSVARRQLAGSVVVAAIIAVVATLIALQPAHRDFAETSSQKIATVQQPSFVAPSGQRLAAVQHAIELP